MYIMYHMTVNVNVTQLIKHLVIKDISKVTLHDKLKVNTYQDLYRNLF
jgi:hypothetical protein